MNPGLFYAALAYTAWGLLPVFFKQLIRVNAFEIVMHRMVWSLVFLLCVLAVLKRWAWLRDLARQPRVLLAFAVSALLLSVNWSVYVWAVQNAHMVDASLGYFILPLVNVALGFAFLNERPRPGQWLAVAVAAAGVLWLTVQAGRLPWVALVLAITFGIYGLLRKLAKLGALEGLTLETLLLWPMAVGMLAWWAWHGQGALVQGDPATLGWLLLAGPLTAIPLLLFAAGARRIPMATLGILQYISPSLQMLLGVWLYGEAFEPARAIGFYLIWAALLLYSADSFWNARKQRFNQ
ncbi:EamA family transporter RarD [Rhodoferax ferrireducens]|uniref:EamA family transporter RarD n=1 Tax=Rhodoferax ferrireducens TaxID=192843 RepID=UPI00298DC530|nr:EamA family transporter RarD [Rhodoferax ferrireducens]WPC66757.1 EamA family transporter RarD [Rhodoferax ferrireducens]